MGGAYRAAGAPVIICQNVREECRLTPMAGNGRRYVELRTYVRAPGSDLAAPTEKKIAVDLELWPQFRVAVSSPETWTRFLPFDTLEFNRDLSRGRLIFLEVELGTCPQEQIFLEHRDFQGIPFIFLKTLARTRRGSQTSRPALGPLLWNQFVTGLTRMAQLLTELGWLAGQAGEAEEKPKIVLVSEKILPMMTHERIRLDKTP
jgi:hypothetical protein